MLLQKRTNAKLRSEIDSLRQQTQKLARLREENQRLGRLKETADTREQNLAREQEQLGRLRSEPKTSKPDSKLSKTIEMIETPNAPFVPSANWANVGVATWADAVQTLFWSKARKDTNVLANTVVWDPGIKARLEAQLAAAPNSVRQRFGSVDGLLYDWWFNYVTSVDGYRVYSQPNPFGDNGGILVQGQHEDRRLPMQLNLILHRDDEAWRVVFSWDACALMASYLDLLVASDESDDKK